MIPSQNGTTCPGGPSYSGAGYLKMHEMLNIFQQRTELHAPAAHLLLAQDIAKFFTK
jgi:hypothetical protein